MITNPYRILLLMVLSIPLGLQASPRNPFAVSKERNNRSFTYQPSMYSSLCGDMEDIQWEYVPDIKVTGIMTTHEKPIITANVEGLGKVILREGDVIVIPAHKGKQIKASWFRVRSVNTRRMILELDDGSRICRGFF